MLIATILNSQQCHRIFTLTSHHEHSANLTIMKLEPGRCIHLMYSQGSSNWINIANCISHTLTLNKNIALTTCTDYV